MNSKVWFQVMVQFADQLASIQIVSHTSDTLSWPFELVHLHGSSSISRVGDWLFKAHLIIFWFVAVLDTQSYYFIPLG